MPSLTLKSEQTFEFSRESSMRVVRLWTYSAGPRYRALVHRPPQWSSCLCACKLKTAATVFGRARCGRMYIGGDVSLAAKPTAKSPPNLHFYGTC